MGRGCGTGRVSGMGRECTYGQGKDCGQELCVGVSGDGSEDDSHYVPS